MCSLTGREQLSKLCEEAHEARFRTAFRVVRVFHDEACQSISVSTGSVGRLVASVLCDHGFRGLTAADISVPQLVEPVTFEMFLHVLNVRRRGSHSLLNDQLSSWLVQYVQWKREPELARLIRGNDTSPGWAELGDNPHLTIAS
jgi:hypothetical protein